VRFVATDLPGVLVVEPDVYRDARGFFLETFRQDKYQEGGIRGPFVQDNQSSSAGGTVRGLHLQVGRRPQGKLVRVLDGVIYDVAVDVRRGSPSFGRWVGAWLSSDDFRQIYIPPGFAHGFAVTSPTAQIEYKCTDVYDPEGEVGIAWNDPAIAIEWPVHLFPGSPLLSGRDANNPPLSALTDRLPVYRATDL
jgi:dTDP-4-dehydrorhamnose 3,5-epimerase